MENLEAEEEKTEVGQQYVGIYLYWPAFYYQI